MLLHRNVTSRKSAPFVLSNSPMIYKKQTKRDALWTKPTSICAACVIIFVKYINVIICSLICTFSSGQLN